MTTTIGNTSSAAPSGLTADPIFDDVASFGDNPIHHHRHLRTTATLLVGGVLLGTGRCEPNATSCANTNCTTIANSTTVKQNASANHMTSATLHIRSSTQHSQHNDDCNDATNTTSRSPASSVCSCDLRCQPSEEYAVLAAAGFETSATGDECCSSYFCLRRCPFYGASSACLATSDA